MLVEYVVMPSAGDVCPICAAPLELLVNLEDIDAPVHAERCTADDCNFENTFILGATWPEGKE